MNKLFLTPTQFRDNRLITPAPFPRKYILFGILITLLTGSVLFFVSRTLWLQSRNRTLTEKVTTLEESFQKNEKEVKNLRDAVESYKKEKESIQFQLQKTQDRLNSLTEEKTYLEEILVNKTKEMERSVEKWEVIFPESENKPGFFAYRIIVFFDEKHHLPVQMELIDWQNRTSGIYEYKDLKINVGEDAEFKKEINPHLYKVYHRGR